MFTVDSQDQEKDGNSKLKHACSTQTKVVLNDV